MYNNMQVDFVVFYTFTAALSLAALHLLSQKQGFGLPGDGEESTLFFCIALSTAAWSCIGVLYGIGSDSPEDIHSDYDLKISELPRPNRLDLIDSKTSPSKPHPILHSHVEYGDRSFDSKPPSPSNSEASGQTTDPDISDESDHDSDVNRGKKRR